MEISPPEDDLARRARRARLRQSAAIEKSIAGNDGARCPSWVYGTASATATGRIERMFRTFGTGGKVA
jgi:hypothetical protein